MQVSAAQYDFLIRNADVVNMFVVGFEDYIACRACWRSNCLFQAAILAEQALEKLFKAGARLGGDVRPFKKMGHHLTKLSNSDWFNTAPYSQLIADLEYHFFNNRYPKTSQDSDVMECCKGISADEFHALDQLVFQYMDALPMEEDVKWSIGVYAEYRIHTLLTRSGIPSLRWETLAWCNQELEVRLPSIESAVSRNDINTSLAPKVSLPAS